MLPHRVIITACTIMTLAGCLSTTQLRVSDPQAEIHVAPFEPQKQTLEYHDRKPFFGGADIQVKKPGCQPQRYRIARSDEFAPEGLILGFFTYGVGFFWTTKYFPSYDLNFQCVAERKTP